MTNPLSPAAQAILDAAVSPPTFATRKRIAAALQAVADQVVPVRAWHESNNDAAWERHQMSVIINRRILAIAAELKGAQ